MSEDEAPKPWEKDPDFWKEGASVANDPRWEAERAPLSAPEQHTLFSATYETDEGGRAYGPLIQARVEPDGTLRLTIRRHTDPEQRDRLVLGVLIRLDREALWKRVRRESGTHAPTVEWWRKSEA